MLRLNESDQAAVDRALTNATPTAAIASCAAYDQALNVVLYSPSAPMLPEVFYRAIGDWLFNNSPTTAREIWNKQLVAADPSVGAAFDAKLSSGQFSSWRALVESFDGAVNRLVALHIANALIANGMPIGDAVGLKVVDWPMTSEFATGKRPMSIIPLTSAYCDANQIASFGAAFAASITGSLSCSRTDVKRVLKQCIDTVVASTGTLKLS